MKRPFILIFLAAILFVSCKKNHTEILPVKGNKIVGDWNINTVTVVPRDSLGNVMSTGSTVTEPSYYHFLFNADGTWVEVLAPDPESDIDESGNYILHADTSFTLINVNAPALPVECSITSISDTSMVFTHQKATLYNGITRGYLEYIFRLKK
jgi:hypothetical protein